MNYMMLELVLGILVMGLPFLGLVILRKMNWLHGTGFLLFGIYLGMVWNVTGLPTFFSFYPEIRGGISLIPFQDFSAFGCIANMIMVMPLGFCLPLLWKRYRSLGKMAAAGFCTSLGIEIIQLFTFRATDIDDLIMNMLGGVVGYGCFWLCCKWFPSWREIWCGRLDRKQERWECFLAFFLVIIIRSLIYPLVEMLVIF